ncbi:methyltransferase domain-containing protein [candidate division KSB3 bacterium]|uniref:Methyltransferase domain-containing protein n=1 Tax=candidate division KSB3 bacterium TaxID=2044937 RepID=A0A9D5JUK4_9BACT|nr:methyltransferase domain-containing protein [candidate division KSB3 bacterium]MBD3324440.1 methyltransferase domain-containing protein [candidate division KSB3 bacterium]
MNDRMMEIFLEIHQDMPRQGPGNFDATRRAFAMLADLPPRPTILDIGCGPGKQTLELSQLTEGRIVAIDMHQPYLDTLAENARRAGVTERIEVVQRDMHALEVEAETYDLIWAEGSIYLIGFAQGLRTWKPFLKPGGYLAATELTWLNPNAPAEVKAFWEEEYPAMQTREHNLRIIQEAGYTLVGHFPLPESAWWEDYYTPLEQRLTAFRKQYADDSDAQTVIDAEQTEIDMYRNYADYYGYVFYVIQKPTPA